MRSDRRSLSIRSRLVLANALLLGAAAVAPFVVLPRLLETVARQELEHRALAIATAFGAASEVALDFGDRQRAGEILRGLTSASEVTYGAITTADGAPLAVHGGAPGLSVRGAVDAPDLRYGADVLHVQVPIVTPSGEHGTLRAGFELGGLRRRRTESWQLVGTTALTVFAVGLGALFFIATLFTKPVRTLTALAERIARGDEAAVRQLETRRQDEAGTVAVALENVVDRLVEQRAMLHSQHEASSEGILTLDLKGNVITHNRRMREMWGMDARELEGARWSTVRPRMARLVAAGLPDLLSPEVPALPGDRSEAFDLGLADGRTLTAYMATVRKPDKEPLGLGLYFRDVTRRVQDQRRIQELAETLERRVAQRTQELARANEELGHRLEELRRTQEQLVVADRRVSVGRLAAGVAHEINNPLSYLLGNISYVTDGLASVRSALAGDEAAREVARAILDDVVGALQDAAEGATRVAHIVQGLKAFSRGDEDERGPVQLGRAMTAALDMAEHEIRPRARLVRRIGAAPLVVANEIRLSQVLLNLLMNAAQAIPEGAAAQHTVTATVGEDEDGWAYAEVRDTGVGIAPEIRGRIFDPFFTTKAQGQGSGLGLSISQGIVASFGGDISVESAPGKGSTFRLRLPPGPETSGPDAPTSLAAAPPVPASRVLIVDDDPQVALALRRLLGREHDVTVVHEGRSALARLHEGERFDVVLCDLMMPGMTGMEVYDELLGFAPDQARSVIFMSGGAFTSATEAFAARHRERFVSKPVDLGELRRVIHAISKG